MSRLQSIESALSSISEAVFQELCDSFLAIRNKNYKAFSRAGSQSGKQKTTIGTPDSLFLLPNGKYIFVEHSTNITKGVSKIKEDIAKCLDAVKTGIPLNQISEIIICINFNLKSNEIEQVRGLLSSTRIQLTLYTLDSLAIELHLHHRDLAHQYLGLSFDTGQIVSIEKFIEEYNRASNGIATPLNNVFLHRENELKLLKDSILIFDFIILTGAPGVGKTRLALEAIKEFLKENHTFGSYCISYKNHTLLNDLYQYFDTNKDYILFVDDANRIDAFNQITGFYKATRQGKLKILITVRDYAFPEIDMLCHEFNPKRIDLLKLTDEQIIDILKSESLQIINQEFQDRIVRIVDGNPRLAMMTALLAKAEQNLNALSDVSDLFEKYFFTFVRDQDEFAKQINLKCLGLIAFFYTIPYKNRELATPILNDFGIDYSEFIDAVDKLDKLELAEAQFEYVKIPEQNLATFFFYKAFIKENLLSFEKLLAGYFESNNNRFRDCIIPANNTFGPERVMNKLKPDLQQYWHVIKNGEEKAYKFLSTFWFYLQSETLEYIYNKIEILPTTEVLNYEVAYENNAFAYDKNNIIELLGEFFRFQGNLKNVLELSFEYVRKDPKQLPELIHKIREELLFDHTDWETDFIRQRILFEILLNGLDKSDKLLSVLFFELSKTFLSFRFHHTKSGRNRSIVFYDYPLPNTQSVQEFRSKIWMSLKSNFTKYPIESFQLLKNYSRATRDVVKEILEFDTPFVIEIIDEHLTPDVFESCLYVQDQVRWYKRNTINNSAFTTLVQKFRNQTYETFLKIDWNRFRDKEMFDYTDFREYDKLKEEEIRISFVFQSSLQIEEFYDVFVYLKKSSENNWNYNNVLDIVIDQNCNMNFDLGCKILDLIIESNNSENYIPRKVFFNHLKTKEKAQAIWNLIKKNKFKQRTAWELSFYDYIDTSLISKTYAKLILDTIDKIDEPISIHFGMLVRYLSVEPSLFQQILKLIVDKNDNGARIQIWIDLFNDYFEKLGEDIDLIEKAYLQQDKLQAYFDFEGKSFLNILKGDQKFLYKYVVDLYSKSKFITSKEYGDFGFVWEVENIEKYIIEVFDLLASREPYFGIGDHFCNAFFKKLAPESTHRAEAFLIEYVKTYHSDSHKMNIVIDIVRHTMKHLFEKILLLYISLNQDVDKFSKVWWRGNGGSYSGNVIIGDVEAAQWKNILSIVEKSDVGIKLMPIKKYLSGQVESSLRSGDWERKRRFLERG